jgi:transcription antitermination factor NusG
MGRERMVEGVRYILKSNINITMHHPVQPQPLPANKILKILKHLAQPKKRNKSQKKKKKHKTKKQRNNAAMDQSPFAHFGGNRKHLSASR